jgi:shikimate 5-dehydrogenase/shikimate kinase
VITIIVGHRGSGKSSFISRIVAYFGSLGQEIHTFDVDKEIEKRTSRTIREIFENDGEPAFRKIEQKIFADICGEAQGLAGTVYVAVGAGYMGEFPIGAQVIWLRRPSDRAGRIFVDRPRLDSQVNPLQEFLDRFTIREARFARVYHRQVTIPEGWDFVNTFEPYVLGLKPAEIKAPITLLPEHFENSLRLEDFIQDKLQLGVSYFELRDDLLSEKQIVEIAAELPREKVLISFRRLQTSPSLVKFAGPYTTDWALELGPSPFSHNEIVSVHTRGENESVDEVVERLLAVEATHYKLAIAIDNFVELWAGHRFFNEDTQRRSFLPNSKDGRWQWYRLSQHRKMKLNFVRDGEPGTGPDQPLLFDFIRYPETAKGFAAVLGSPVGHSHTPAEHFAFFSQHHLGVLAITVHEHECNSLTFSVLERMGLRAAAITSPLKTLAARVCEHLDKKSSEIAAVNTMIKTTSGWSGVNTDITGLSLVLKTLELPREVAVWGGGGTRRVLKDLLPHAHFFSARRGEEIWTERFDNVKTTYEPKMLVWALGRSRLSTSKWPPTDWRPEYVLDLNYTEDSPGLEYALRVGAKYISGRGFFKAQAAHQREFWQNELRVVKSVAPQYELVDKE